MFCPSTGLCYTVNACVFPWKTFFRQPLPRNGPQGGRKRAEDARVRGM